MYFHIKIRAEPFAQLILAMGAPQNAPVQDSAVFKAVWQAADINGAPVSKFIDSHLHFFFALHQNTGVFIGKDVFLPFAEIDLSPAFLL